MVQSSWDTYLFHLGRSAYMRISLRGLLLCGAFLTSAVLALLLSHVIWGAYSHDFTPYLKWQDALEALLWFIAFLTVGGSILVMRFLYALYAGYRKGMLTLVSNTSLVVRDLSSENLASILWMMHSAFWCFVAVLVGILPETLFSWTLHLPNIVLVVFATGAVSLLSLAGLVVSVVGGAFIVIGCVGAFSFSHKMGGPHRYKLSSHTILRIDNFVLTIIYPDKPESMIDLNLLAADDQRQLLALLHACWIDAQYAWNPGLGKEIKDALKKAEQAVEPLALV